MILRYGSYTHANDEVRFVVNRKTRRGDDGDRDAIVLALDISGRLLAANSTALLALRDALEAAYEQDYQDVEWSYDSGVTAFSLRNADTLEGIRVVDAPSYDGDAGAEWGTQLSYSITLEAEIPYRLAGAQGGAPVEFEETIQFSGGGPVRVVLDCLDDLPEEQVVQMHSAYRATQSGSLVSRSNKNPTPPPPIWPDKLERAPTITRVSPQKRDRFYGVQWQYTFASATPLIGRPHEWK